METIPSDPPTPPAHWCDTQSCGHVDLGGVSWLITQPSSTLIVYGFGLLTVACGVFFLSIRQGQQTRLWWGVALLLWGVGALLAGSSYEGFGWYLKCQGRDLCTWTDGLEVAYLLLSTASIDALVVAELYSGVAAGPRRTWLARWAALNLGVYVLLVAIGTLVPQKFLISFTLLVLFAAPNLLLFFWINGRRYLRRKDQEDRNLLLVWGWLALTILAYGVYDASGLTQRLFAQGIWFSQDDVLHLGLSVWVLLIWGGVARQVHDLPAAPGGLGHAGRGQA